MREHSQGALRTPVGLHQVIAIAVLCGRRVGNVSCIYESLIRVIPYGTQ